MKILDIISESGKASRKLCKSTKSDSELGASQLSSCKSQGLRSRDTEKQFTINKKRKSINAIVNQKIFMYYPYINYI
jgi:hypothetical protein